MLFFFFFFAINHFIQIFQAANFLKAGLCYPQSGTSHLGTQYLLNEYVNEIIYEW